jgi:hypothetical protein
MRAVIHGLHVRTSSGACAVPDAHAGGSANADRRQHRAAPPLIRKSSSAALSLLRARVGRRRLSNAFRAIHPFRLANDLGAQSGTKDGVTQPRRVASRRWFRWWPLRRVASAAQTSSFCSSRGSNLRYATLRFELIALGFSPEQADNPGAHRADACTRAKYRHCSACARDGLTSFPASPLHFTSSSHATPPFHCVPKSANW